MLLGYDLILLFDLRRASPRPWASCRDGVLACPGANLTNSRVDRAELWVRGLLYLLNPNHNGYI